MSEVRYCGTGGALVKPDDPSNESILSAVPAFGGIDVSWTYPGINPEALAHTILYRNTADDFASASIHARVSGSFFFDSSKEEAPTRYYYWIKHLSINGTLFPEIGPATAIARLPIAQVIEGLTAEIDNGFLAISLREKIESISVLRQNIEDEIAARMAELSLVSDLFEDIRVHSEQTRVLLNEERALREEEFAIVIDGLNSTYAELLTSVDAERVRIETIRNQAFSRLDSVEADIDSSIIRLGVIESNLLGPDTADGTVANRIKAEREARIAGLDGERDERIVAIQYESDARIDAIQAEAIARGEQIFQVETRLKLEQGYFASQLDVVAAAYQANTATTYSLEEVRVTDSEATATRINGLEVVVDDNKASIVEESQVRASETSALAAQVSVLSAKLDALPTFANSFELGVEFDRWTIPTGHDLTSTDADTFAGDQAGLLSSTEINVATGTIPFGVSISLASGTSDSFAGRRLRVGLATKAVTGGSAEYGIGYATSDGWFSGWQLHNPESLWSVQETFIDIPDTPGLSHYIVLWGDTSGSDGEVLIDRLLVEVANTDIPEITSQIENIQQALVDTEQAMAEDITNLQSVYDTQISDIQNTQTTLSTKTSALSTDLQTLTATTGDLTADIQNESLVRANETEALAQDVTDLWVGVGNTEGQITRETEARAEEGHFRGLIQDVMQANVETSAATFTSIKEVVVEKDAVMARNVAGIEGRVGEAEGAVTDIMQLNISPTSALVTRFSSVEGKVADAEGAIKNIESLDIGPETILAGRLSTIDGKIADSEGAITAIETLEIDPTSVLASTLNSLDGRVGSAEGDVTAITNLTLSPTSVLASTLTELDGRVGTSEGTIKDINDLTVGPDSVLGTTITDITGRVAEAEGSIESITTLTIDPTSVLASKLETMEGKIGTTEGNVADLVNLTVGEDTVIATRFSELDGRVGEAEGNITRAEELKVEDDKIRGFISDVMSASTATSSAAYKSMTSVVVEKDRVVGERLFQISGEVEDAKANITTLDILLVTGDQAILGRMDKAEGEVDNTYGLVQDIYQMNLGPETALFQRFDTIEGNVGDTQASIDNILELNISPTSVLMNRFETIEASVGDADAAIRDVVSLDLTEDTALINRFNEVEASVGDASGRISDMETLDVNSTTVFAATMDTIQANIGDAAAAITDIKSLNLSETDALLNTLNQVKADIGDAAADIKNIAHIELTGTSAIAQQFNTIDAAFGSMETRYRNVVTMNLEEDSNIAKRFEELGTAERSIYDIMEMNVDAVGGTQLVQRLIGVENETSKVQLKAASYSGAIIQNGSFSTGDLDNWSGWSGVSVVRRDEASTTSAIRNIPSEYAARFDDSEHEGSNYIRSSLSPINGGEDYTFRLSYAGGGSVNIEVQVLVRWFNLSGAVSSEQVSRFYVTSTAWETTPLYTAKAPDGATEALVDVKRLSGGSGSLHVTDIRGNRVGEALGSLFTAKVEENGLIGGFGIYNDGEIVEAGFDVDRFWIGRTNTNAEGYKVKPFIIENNEVFMDEAVINKLTFDKLRAADGSLIVENGKVKGDFIEAKDLVVKESATFTGVAQSKDFVSGSPGWKLDPINNTGEINFPINFSNVSGAGSLASKDSLFYSEVFGTKPPEDATRNDVTRSSTAPSGAVNGDIWIDISSTPAVIKLRQSGAWQLGANLTTDTSHLVDSAQLGQTANWGNVTGNGRPQDGATQNRIFYTDLAPLSAESGDLWVTPNGDNFIYASGSWRSAGDITSANTAFDTARVAGESASEVRDKANAANNRINDWVRPSSTRIDGNKIWTGDAYVDTLEIKGNAVTIPVSAAAGSNVSISGGAQILSVWIDAKNANVMVMASFSGGPSSSISTVQIRRNGDVVLQRNVGGNTFFSIAGHVGATSTDGADEYTMWAYGSGEIGGRSLGLLATRR